MIRIAHVANRGWYAARGYGGDFTEYLHKDGCWRKTTANLGDTQSGYFPSEESITKEAKKFDDEIRVSR